MPFNRRDALAMTGSAAIVATVPVRLSAEVEDALQAFTGGAEVASTGIKLTIPALAENGFAVPVSFDAPGAEEVAIIAERNPLPLIARFTFGRLSGQHSAATRMRLAASQTVVAVARMADGSFAQDAVQVEVIVGGCGSEDVVEG